MSGPRVEMAMSSWVRIVCAVVVAGVLAGCAGVPASAGVAPTTDVNPITGSRGGSGASH